MWAFFALKTGWLKINIETHLGPQIYMCLSMLGAYNNDYKYKSKLPWYMIKIFRGGGRGEGVVDGEGGSSEGCLKWGGGGGGSLRDLSKNILKQGVRKGKSCS